MSGGMRRSLAGRWFRGRKIPSRWRCHENTIKESFNLMFMRADFILLLHSLPGAFASDPIQKMKTSASSHYVFRLELNDTTDAYCR